MHRWYMTYRMRIRRIPPLPGTTLPKLMLMMSLLAVISPLSGCKREAQPVASQPPTPPAESNPITDGKATWQVGATAMNGTNISSSNITVRVRTNRVAN